MTDSPDLRTLSELERKACVVVGTRPGIVMMAPVIRELARRGLPHFVLHTDQHYSRNMDAQFFEDLQLPEPDHRLEGVAGQTLHGAQTAAMLTGCEQVLLAERPSLVLVGGDANTNLAAALAARKLHIQLGHVEAGERSMDWRMPEEHNRVVIDHISEYLFTTNHKASERLRSEQVRGEIVETGNPIVDAARQNRDLATAGGAVLEDLRVAAGEYFLMTAHREENVDSQGALRGILEGAKLIAERLDRPTVFAIHPRTERRLSEFGLDHLVASTPGLIVVPALRYLSFLSLLSAAALVLTDSGGVQQEACLLQVPCVTLRETTEWSETLAIGANMLAGTDPNRIVAAAEHMLAVPTGWTHPFGDGFAASRIVDTVQAVLNQTAASRERPTAVRA
jgi:UDP-N-acetylglucosamine 2-epimerase (non-hydrolysing)